MNHAVKGNVNVLLKESLHWTHTVQTGGDSLIWSLWKTEEILNQWSMPNNLSCH